MQFENVGANDIFCMYSGTILVQIDCSRCFGSTWRWHNIYLVCIRKRGTTILQTHFCYYNIWSIDVGFDILYIFWYSYRYTSSYDFGVLCTCPIYSMNLCSRTTTARLLLNISMCHEWSLGIICTYLCHKKYIPNYNSSTHTNYTMQTL